MKGVNKSFHYSILPWLILVIWSTSFLTGKSALKGTYTAMFSYRLDCDLHTKPLAFESYGPKPE